MHLRSGTLGADEQDQNANPGHRGPKREIPQNTTGGPKSIY